MDNIPQKPYQEYGLGISSDAHVQAPLAVPYVAPAHRRFGLSRRGYTLMMYVVLALIIAAVGIFSLATHGTRQADLAAFIQGSQKFDVQVVPLSTLLSSSDFGLSTVQSLSVNGQLQVNNSLVLAPADRPLIGTTGQLYYDKTDNAPAYYDGSRFVTIANTDQLNILRTQLQQIQAVPAVPSTNTASVPSDTASLTADNTFSGFNTFNAGINADNLTVAGSTSLQGLLTVAGSTILGPTTISSLLLNSPLATGSGGTGTTSLANNGVLIGQGSNPIDAVIAAGSNLCLMSTSGAPVFAACPGITTIVAGNGINVANTNEVSVQLRTGYGLEFDTASPFGVGLMSCTASQVLKSNGGGWSCAADSDTPTPGDGQGVTMIGTLDSGTASANGASLSGDGSTIYLQSATATRNGLVTTGAQTFAGDKTFSGNLDLASGSFMIGGTSVLTAGRVLQNVTTDASILTSGIVNTARIVGNYGGITGTGALASGSIAAGFGTITTGNTIQGAELISTVATGTAPLTVSSTTKVVGLNADLLDGFDSSAFCQGSCLATGTAGGDLSGSYPNPTIAKLQGKTLTVSATPVTGAVLQYNGSAFVDGLLSNTNLNTGTYTNITGTGTLTTGSIASGFGTINTTNNITTSAALQGSTVNATSALQVGGVDINTAGTLSNVAYLSQNNTFTGTNSFQNTSVTALRVQNALSVNVLTADTSGLKLVVGSSTTDANAVLFVIDSYNNATDPTGVNGAMYYNTSLGKFRCYEASVWRDCIGTSFDPEWPDGAVGTAINAQVDNFSTYTVPANKTLYITQLYSGNTNSYLDVNGLDIYNAGSTTTTFTGPIVAGAGDVVRSSSVNYVYFSAMLVDQGVTTINTQVNNFSTYTVPAGKTLYITQANTSSGVQIRVNGRILFPGNATFTGPIVASPGDVVSSNLSNYMQFSGFLY